MKFTYNFHRGACVEYSGESTDPMAKVEFIDIENNNVIYSCMLSPNSWAKPTPEHYIKWELRASIDDKIVFNHIMDLTGKRVIIVFQYTTLGDFLYWMPVFEKFRIKHNCMLIVHVSRSLYVNVVQKSYPNIIFTTDYSLLINESIYAIYEVDMKYCDEMFYQTYPCYNSPQQTALDFLGIKGKLLPLSIDTTDDKPIIDGKYVCITEHGQSNPEKSWLYPNGWQTVANYLVDNGYKVVPISSEPTNISGTGIINKTGIGLKEMIQYIKYSSLFIGGSTAPTHISHCLGIPTIMIVTNTWQIEELPIHYVYNHTEGTCFGCYTRESKDNGVTCNKRNPYPECSMNITPNMVIETIKKVLDL